jgi:hypothetical protein
MRVPNGLADIAVFFGSYERRALHDLVAGTVVILKVPRVVGAIDGVEPHRSSSGFRS